MSQDPTGTGSFSDTLNIMMDGALKQLKVDSTRIGNLFALPKKLTITESGLRGIARLINPVNTTTGSNREVHFKLFNISDSSLSNFIPEGFSNLKIEG